MWCYGRHSSPFNFETIGGITVEWLTSIAVRCPKRRALLLQPRRNNFTSHSTRKNSVIYPSLSVPPTHVSSWNGQYISELFCVHCPSYYFSVLYLHFLFNLSSIINDWVEKDYRTQMYYLFRLLRNTSVCVITNCQCTEERDVIEKAWSNTASSLSYTKNKQWYFPLR
jgi:hypothetical protein